MDSLGKLIFCLFLACIVNSVQGEKTNATGLPTFAWGENKDEHAPISLTISFPDGGQDDVVELHQSHAYKQDKTDKGDQDEVDPCILNGYFKGEEDVYVSVNGCPQSKDFEIAFDSHRLDASMFKVVNGKTEKVSNMDERGLSGARVDVLDNPHFDFEEFKKVSTKDASASWSGNHPNHCGGHCHLTGCRCQCEHLHFTLGIAMMYSIEWYQLFKGGSVNALRRVLNMVQNIFYWKSAPLRLTLRATRYQYIGSKWTANAKDLNYLSSLYWPYGNYYGGQLTAFMTFEGHKAGVVGITYKPALCGYYRFKGLIAEYFRGYQLTAEVLSHEIGHAFGIGHDFGPNHQLRRDHEGKRCSGVGGIMGNFGRWPRCWSNCSCEDWCKFYKFVLRTKDRFCLDCRDKFPFCAYAATMAMFFCRSAVVRRSCPRACGLCGNRAELKNYGTGIISNLKLGASGPAALGAMGGMPTL